MSSYVNGCIGNTPITRTESDNLTAEYYGPKYRPENNILEYNKANNVCDCFCHRSKRSRSVTRKNRRSTSRRPVKHTENNYMEERTITSNRLKDIERQMWELEERRLQINYEFESRRSTLIDELNRLSSGEQHMNRKSPQRGREQKPVNGWPMSNNQAGNQSSPAPRHTMNGCVCGQNLPERSRSNSRRVHIGPTTYDDEEMPSEQRDHIMQPVIYKSILKKKEHLSNYCNCPRCRKR